MPKREYPTLVTWTDPTGKTHVPPDPPLVKGYPPWWPRPNEYRRKVPLKACPSLACRRARRCESLLYGEFCRKTHMEREDFRAALLAKITAYLKARNIPEGPPSDNPPPREMKEALQARQDEIEREELLKFQTGWIEEQKAKWKSKAPLSPPGSSPNKLGERKSSPSLSSAGGGGRRPEGGLPPKPAINPVEFRPTLTTR